MIGLSEYLRSSSQAENVLREIVTLFFEAVGISSDISRKNHSLRWTHFSGGASGLARPYLCDHQLGSGFGRIYVDAGLSLARMLLSRFIRAERE